MCKKADVLDAGGYLFDYEYLIYINKERKALFSHLFINERSADEIEACIASANPERGWQFFFLKPPHPHFRERIERLAS